MNENDKAVEGHSERYFTESRNHWYNPDFLELLAKRWELGKHRKLLDIGAGLCHWSKLLTSFLAKPAEVIALDFDPKWVTQKENHLPFFEKENTTFDYLQSDAHSLPFPDDFFDVVTCQTVLIHLEDPEQALNEMKRVVRPGGIVICAEPNNRVQFLLQDSLTRNEDVEATLQRVKAGLDLEMNKKLTGNGDDSFGDLLAGTMNRLGFHQIQSYLNDKLVPLFPPYATKAQQSMINYYLDWENDDRLFEKEKEFLVELNERDFQRFLQNYQGRSEEDQMLNALKNNAYFNGGSSMLYLVSGSK